MKLRGASIFSIAQEHDMRLAAWQQLPPGGAFGLGICR